MAKEDKPGDIPKKDDKPAKEAPQKRGPPRLKSRRPSSGGKVTGTN